MSLNPGQQLGPYLIEEQAGAGGMGEVYRAKDTRLDRIVAVKVLPGTGAENADIRARFQREAKSISSLNHPNICVLHDIGHEDGIDYLVMEYIEGVTLAEKLSSGPLDLNEVFDIASQISDALDKAHRQGLVHRDLKPANVMLTREGAKLLDFGLAKLHSEGGPVKGISQVTQTTPITGAGAIVGTIQYMAPEQLEGKEADPRSDIFSFGALLYEMITGTRAFESKSQASAIAAIIEREPIPVSEIKPLTPPGLTRLVRKCLAKDPEDRWQSARDLCDELRWISQSGSQAGVASAIVSKRKLKFRLAWVIAAVAILGAAASNGYWLMQPEEEKLVRRFEIYANPGLIRVDWPQISPDGRFLVYRAFDSTNRSQLWVRKMDALESYALPGTESSNRPFWSPDSRYLGFMNGDQLKRVPVNGGPAQLLAEFPGAADGTWGSGGVILMDGSAADSIRGISVSGGDVFAATKIDRTAGETYHAWPEFFPDGKHFIYLASGDSSVAGVDTDYKAYIGRIDSDLKIPLFSVNSRVVYAQQGYLIYERGGILLAQGFDFDALELSGESTPITDEILNRTSGNIGFTVSRSGSLVFETQSQGVESEIKVLDRSGREIEVIAGKDIYTEVQLSPDETRILYTREDSGPQANDIWVKDLERGATWRLTFSSHGEYFPRWSADGREVFYSSGNIPRLKAFVKSSDGSQTERPIELPDSLVPILMDVSSDRKLYSLTSLRGQPDFYTWEAAGDSEPKLVTGSPAPEFGGLFSPNGKYVCYASGESGRSEIYVRRSDGSGGKWQISTSGGTNADWSADGKELFYVEPDKDFMVVPVETENVFTVGVPKKLFRAQLTNHSFGYPRWSVSADGQRFYMPIELGTQGEAKFQYVENWVEELRGR